MKIVNLEQGTKEWLDWRKFGITATDAYTIMGHGFETPFSLWEVKTGKRNAPDINNVLRGGKVYRKISCQWLCR